MEEVENIQQTEDEKAQIIKIEYEQPKFAHRVLANFIDILLMVFVTILLFIASRAIIQNSSFYQENDRRYKNIELESALFVNVDAPSGREYQFGDLVQVITTYLPSQDTLTYKDICRRSDNAIYKFFTYLEGINLEASTKAKEEFNSARLALKGDVVGHENYFVKKIDYDIVNKKYLSFNPDDEIIIPLNDSEIPYYNFQTYFENFYRLFIDDKLIDNYLVKYVPELSERIANEGKYVLFIEFPSAYILAAILVYFVPTLFFKRGRKTLGKALYHIGLVDTHCFSPSFGRNLARFAIFLFAELILSVVTFGLPFLISFTVMLVSKRKQGFPDYLLGLTEIDTSKQKIYYNKIEILTDKASIYKKAPDFKLPNL